MRSILLAHAARYPLIEPTDAVKLIYQNEFGGGHLIRDEKRCLEFLRNEYRSVPQSGDTPLLEDIGNGFFRVNLSALDASGMTAEELGSAFIHSSQLRGCLDSFLAKLAVLRSLTGSGQMPFSPEALDAYLSDYEKAGFPPVSHSETYRNAYHPAYRVVSQNCLPRQVR